MSGWQSGWVSAGVVAALLFGTRTVHAQCEEDTECKRGRVCQEGVCVDRPVACTKDTDCAGDLICTANVCRAPAAAGSAPDVSPPAGPEEQPAPPEDPEYQSRRRRKIGFMIAGGVVSAAGVGVALFGGLLLVEASQERDQCDPGSCGDAGDAAEAVGWVGIGAGAAVTVTGLILLAHGLSIDLAPPPGATRPTLRLRSFALVPHSGGATMGASFSF
jgi:hypothetical protein